MQKALVYLYLLLFFSLVGCDDHQKSSFVPWQLIDAETTHILSFNNTPIALQNLRQTQSDISIFSLPKLPLILDSLVIRFKSEQGNLLFINNPGQNAEQGSSTPSDYVLVLSLVDSIRSSLPNEIVIDSDTTFVFSENEYSLFSNKKTLAYKTQISRNEAPSALSKMFALKKDKPLLVGQRFDHTLGKISLQEDAWIIFEPQASSEDQSAHGVLLPSKSNDISDEKPTLSPYDLGQKPSVLKSPEIVPLNASYSLSLALNNPQSLLLRMQSVDSMLVLSPFIESIDEVSLIKFSSTQALALKSLDLNMSLSALTQDWVGDENFRGISIKSFDSQTNILNPLPLIFEDIAQMNHVFVWEDFIILTPNLDLAQEYVGQLQNKNTLAQSSAWQASEAEMAREGNLFSWTADPQNKRFECFQLIEDRGFAHVNYSTQAGGQKVENQTQGPLLRSITLDAPLAKAPQFFSNHKSGGKNIVVQDENHRLYFIAPSGKTIWFRDLNEPILGEVQEVDILRNGKKQLAFTTTSKWYIIDRNGRDVSLFPKSFKDPITQPLAIFDYDNNRKYRFVIIQTRSVLMSDAQGKRVKGFSFDKAPAVVSHPPKHIRIGTKDYLLFLLENGQLQILNRTGKVRIPVTEQFDFGSELPLKHEGKIVFWTQEGSQIQISPEGSVVKLTAKSPAQYRLVYYGPHTIEFDDPLLRIDQHFIELPLGNYLGPQVFKFGNKLRTVMIDQDTQNVFVYNSEGRLLKNAPFFGRSTVDIADINGNDKLELLVQGQDNEVLIYNLN